MSEEGDQSVFVTLGKFIGGKVLTAILVASVLLTSYYFYKNPEKLETLWESTKASLVWLGFVAVLPWGLFFVSALVVRVESNLVSALVLGGYLLVDVLMAFFLTDWRVEGGALTWAVLILGFLCAGVYNFVITESLARKADDTL